MPFHGLKTISEIASMITAGRVLLLAGDEALLETLPAGNWIAATSGNFMTDAGGVADRRNIFYTDITDDAESTQIKCLSLDELPRLAENYPVNGFTVLIVPGLSDFLASFATNVSEYKDIFNAPLAGWVSGVPVEDIGKATPKIFAGNREGFSDHAAVMYVSIPEKKSARLDIINLFSPGKGASLQFRDNSFSVADCEINGKLTNLSGYLAEQSIDTKLPLVADYNGAMINVSIQSVDSGAGVVHFYAPVFPGIVYHFATPVPDYTAAFKEAMEELEDAPPVFSCNCILNYLYAGLEGKSTAPFVGPITFGEIAYILLNQTLVYLTIDTLED
jgi:hypothetical protein